MGNQHLLICNPAMTYIEQACPAVKTVSLQQEIPP